MRHADGHHDPRDAQDGAGDSAHLGRLNLLLSYAGWEDQPWVERLPRLLEPMGIRSLHARCGREATEVINTEPVHIAIVDLGLPLDRDAASGPAGAKLLEVLRRLEQPPPTVVVREPRTQRENARDLAAALKVGAFAVVHRPRASADLELMLELMRRVLQRHYQGRWPGGPTL
ncbi:MAG: response regulator [Planctomycetota bacterium]